MTKYKFAHNTRNLIKDPADYWHVLRDVQGNILHAVKGFIELYENFKNKKSLISYKEKAGNLHLRFTDIILDLITIAEKEEVGRNLLDLLKKLRDKSNFDWGKPDRFKKFMQDSQIILDDIEKL